MLTWTRPSGEIPCGEVGAGMWWYCLGEPERLASQASAQRPSPLSVHEVLTVLAPRCLDLGPIEMWGEPKRARLLGQVLSSALEAPRSLAQVRSGSTTWDLASATSRSSLLLASSWLRAHTGSTVTAAGTTEPDAMDSAINDVGNGNGNGSPSDEIINRRPGQGQSSEFGTWFLRPPGGGST